MLTLPLPASITAEELTTVCRSFFHHLPYGVRISNEEWSIVYANPAALRLYGYSWPELQGRKSSECCGGSPEYIAKKLQEILESVQSFGVWNGEFIHRRKDGSEFLCGINTTKLNVDNKSWWLCIHRDITDERTRSLDARSNAALLKQISDSVGDALWVYSLDRQLMLYISPAFSKIWGRPVEPVYSSPFSILRTIYPADRKSVISKIRQHISDNFAGDFAQEFRIVLPSGSVRWVWSRYVPVRDDQGKVVRIAGVTSEITSRKLEEQRLQQARDTLATQFSERTEEVQRLNSQLLAEQRQRTRIEDALRQHSRILRRTHTAVIETTLDGIITAWNQPAEVLTGYTESETLGKSITSLYEHEECIMCECETSCTGSVSRNVQVKGTRKDGQRFYADLIECNVCAENGLPIGRIHCLMDITQRSEAEEAIRESEKRLRDILDSLFIFVGLFSPEGILLKVNRAPLEISGVTAESVLGKHLWDTNWWSESIADQNHLKSAFEKVRGGEAVRYDVTVQVNDTRRMTIDVCFSPLFDKNQNVSQIIGSAVDITDRIKGQDEAVRLHDELAHISRIATLGEMATGIAHELNQPLTAIATGAATMQMLAERGATGDIARAAVCAQSIQDQAIRAGDIVKRLRDLVRKRSSHRTSIRINELVSGILPLVGPEAKLANIRIEKLLDPDIPILNADSIQIQQVIINLLRNAIEAAAESSTANRCVQIFTEPHDANRVVLVTVTNTGPTLTSHQSNRLFEPFYTTKDGGLGLGLIISRTIIQNHGGQLWYEPLPNGTTTFRFTLPMNQSF